jgi:hypothetical protein
MDKVQKYNSFNRMGVCGMVYLGQDRDQRQALVNTVMNRDSNKRRRISCPSDYLLLRKDSAQWS